MFIYRTLLKEVQKTFKKKKGIAVIGPRRIGKSSLLYELKKNIETTDGKKTLFFNLDDLELRTKIINEKNFLLREVKMADIDYLFIDEAQKLPEIFEQVKMLLDQNKTKIILSGSSSLQIRQKTAETFGGRVRTMRMFPFTLSEIHQTDSLIKKIIYKKNLTLTFLKKETQRLWKFKNKNVSNLTDYLLTGFLPEVFLEKNLKEKFQIIKDFVQNYLEKDILLLSRILKIEDFRRSLTQFAFQNGQILNAVNLSTESGLARKTIQNYLSLLKNTFIIHQIPAFPGKKRSAIFKTPKIFFFDSGVVNYLLGFSSFNEVVIAQKQGSLAETFVLSQILPQIENLAPQPKIYYWQSYQAHEIDFILQIGLTKIPIEVTLSQKIKPAKIKNFEAFFAVNDALYGIILYSGELSQIKIAGKKVFLIPFWMWM